MPDETVPEEVFDPMPYGTKPEIQDDGDDPGEDVAE